MSFSSFKLHPKITASVNALGYKIPTPIQVQAIPPVLAGKDVMGLAQTGTGKTAAFVLPILERLLPGPRGKVRALIIAPTRELAEQTHVSIGEMGRKHRPEELHDLRRRGRESHRSRNCVPESISLSPAPAVCSIILIRRQSTLRVWRSLSLTRRTGCSTWASCPMSGGSSNNCQSKRQTLMFSATMADDIRKLTDEVLHDPVTIKIGHSAPAHTVSHALYPVEQHLKTGLLMELLKHTDTESILIFTRTKHRAKRIGQQLEKAGYKAASLQGNLSQNKRQDALDGFRNGSYQILVATDIAARGIDVLSISHVINYDIPDTTDAYTHRDRPDRSRRKDRRRLHLRQPLRTSPWSRASSVCSAQRSSAVSLKDFDYKKAAPARDVEFARPPREPQRRRTQPKPEQTGARMDGAARPRTPSTQPSSLRAVSQTRATASPPREGEEADK